MKVVHLQPKIYENMSKEISFTIEHSVQAHESALAMGSGDMEVFATPAMVALMENAAAQAAKTVLDEGQTTVGTNIAVSHVKASRIGATVVATAVLVQQEGRRLLFNVEARDGEAVIGEGTHTRYIVEREKFLSKL